MMNADFATALLDPTATPPAQLKAPGGLPAGKRFDVYRNNVTASLVDAMATGFPVVERLVGHRNFKTLAVTYIRKYPPTSPVLMFYGDKFPDFIAGFEPLQSYPYLPDVARLELARRAAYHAADAPHFGPDEMQTAGEDALVAGYLVAAPATFILSSNYPIHDIWLRNSGVPDHPIGQDAQHVLLTRPAFDVQTHPIPLSISVFLQALGTQTVGSAITAALDQDPNFPLADILGLILTSGFATTLAQDKS